MSRKKRKQGQGGTSPQPSQTQPKAAGPQKPPVMVIAVSVAVLVLLLGVAWWWMNRENEPVTPQSNSNNPVVVIETNRGTIEVELYPQHAPITVKNFLQYVDDKHYDGTIFHRVISDFMIQGGGMTKDMIEKKTRPPIENESSNGLPNKRGTIAMARTKIPDSATAQFYINVKDNDSLDRANAPDNVGYAVFGKVTNGMDVVDEIRYVETLASDRPVTDVVIKSVRRAKRS